MSTNPTASTSSRSSFDSTFNAALDAYKERTKQDLASHPILPRLQTCDSPDAIISIIREQIPTFNHSSSTDDRLTKLLIPTINVLYAFSSIIGQGIGLVFPPGSVIFAGISVLLSAAKDVIVSQDTLISLFSRIEYFFKRLEIYTAVPPTTAMLSIVVEIMVEVISCLAIATKQVKQGRMKKYFKKLIGNTDLEDALQRLDMLTQEEARMASAELLKISHSTDDKVIGVSEQVQDLDGKLDNVNRNLLRDNLLRWLSPPDPSTNHNIACKAQHKGTAQWFFQSSIFNQWKSTGSLLWIHGKPGSGKSILCSSIIQDILSLRDAGRASIAYFYFDFRDLEKQKLRNLLPSLLVQLSARSDPCCDVLSKLYAAHDRGVQKPSDRAMIECLKEMLTLEAQGPIYIIMDALDECPITSSIPSPREEILDLVDELAGLLPNLHICITSRPEPDIHAILEPLTLHPVSLHDETGQRQDFANYVGSFVNSDRRMRRWREEDKDLVIKTLSEKADGMFRWVFCQLEVLRHCFPSGVRRILEELPDSLDETYKRVLREIRKANQGHAHRLLQCLVVAVRPLRVEELAEVLAFDFKPEGIPKLNPSWRWEDQEEAVISACSSLVIVVNYGDSRTVQFSHFSVKEFLTSSRLAESSRDVSRYHVHLEPAHTILAQACLGVLFRLDDRVDRDSIKNFPLARYAAAHWGSHARFGNVSSCIKDGMECLFDVDKPHFATWFWIYDNDSGQSMSTMCPEKPSAVPLYYAARLGFRDLAEHLVEKHPEDVYAKGGHQMTPLHASVSAGHTDVFSLLIEHFPDVDIRGSLGQTPLHRASCMGRLEIGQQLLDRNADVHAQDEGGWTPLHGAAFFGHFEFARMLLERRAAINAQRNDGKTPLHAATRDGHVDVVRLLLEHGADPNVRDKFGNTPANDASSTARREEIIQLLTEYAAPVLK